MDKGAAWYKRHRASTRRDRAAMVHTFGGRAHAPTQFFGRALSVAVAGHSKSMSMAGTGSRGSQYCNLGHCGGLLGGVLRSLVTTFAEALFNRLSPFPCPSGLKATGQGHLPWSRIVVARSTGSVPAMIIFFGLRYCRCLSIFGPKSNIGEQKIGAVNHLRRQAPLAFDGRVQVQSVLPGLPHPPGAGPRSDVAIESQDASRDESEAMRCHAMRILRERGGPWAGALTHGEPGAISTPLGSLRCKLRGLSRAGERGEAVANAAAARVPRRLASCHGRGPLQTQIVNQICQWLNVLPAAKVGGRLVAFMGSDCIENCAAIHQSWADFPATLSGQEADQQRPQVASGPTASDTDTTILAHWGGGLGEGRTGIAGAWASATRPEMGDTAVLWSFQLRTDLSSFAIVQTQTPDSRL
ncbi:hypothetical protein B0T26DRAFT_671676 [Lasiosphaeria miniovina]|uniref:Uncharacterized protein n=1 Tax=Lasiosphaeria miniovina TaxID=1954250 RepID=A0AA40B3F1_9PEZI|nr:uncharacterized protein B0T26DRAFT_671676 [Lasiosphaeria miniovina]KAK0726942.1 hypothetical protein B0T26DRAFT_671676 [Lasiosphaeria miniovina]